jgi:CDP-diacylglycerol--serine O-phosphatidyltransferase
VFNWVLDDIGKLGWFAAFVYVAGAALRLARFNTQIGSTDKRYFIGLPSPAAAAAVAGLVWAATEYDIDGAPYVYFIAAYVAIVGVLMVSNVLYYSFKDVSLKEKVPFLILAGIVLAVGIISISPATFLWILFLAYAVSGPLLWAWRKSKHKPST